MRITKAILASWPLSECNPSLKGLGAPDGPDYTSSGRNALMIY